MSLARARAILAAVPRDDYETRVRRRLALECRELGAHYSKHGTDTLVSQAVVKLHEIARSLEEPPVDPTKKTDELPAFHDPGKPPNGDNGQ